jgi:hypothetical protein
MSKLHQTQIPVLSKTNIDSLKGIGSRDIIQQFWQNQVVFSLNEDIYWFLIDALLISYCYHHFPSSLSGNILEKYIGVQPKNHIEVLRNMLQIKWIWINEW